MSDLKPRFLWGEFLITRLNMIHYFIQEGRSHAEIMAKLSLEPVQLSLLMVTPIQEQPRYLSLKEQRELKEELVVARAALAHHSGRSADDALDMFGAEREAFERNCSCHLNPPCQNCIDYTELFPEEY
ncbi:hypothetical protein LCGC14_1299500 [marine sediment metagenome]|uniref:Uncharacterized protein n=1 Tax=marine sediment metagenome TaxID=412755 RepID=A0A0F9KQE3_9ZZZZ